MPTPHPRRWAALAAILTAEVMDLLDATVVGVAAPSIRDDLGGDSSLLQWVAAGYTLAFAVGLVTGGRLGDLYGRRRMFLVGLVGFVAFSALCGLAWSPEVLVGARVLQGLFGAVLIPQAFGIIRSMFPPQEMGAALGAFGPTIGLAAVGGPVLAGALIAWDPGGAGWRSVFMINVPIGLLCLALALRTLPESRAADAPRPDPVGMVLVSLGLVLLVFPLVEGRELGWPAWTVASVVASGPVLAGFAVHQVRRRRAGRSPLVEPALFASRAYSAGLLVCLVFFGAMTSLVFAMGVHLQLALGFTPLQAGLAQVPWALGTAVGAVVSGALLARVGRPVLQGGAVVMAAGVAVLLVTYTTTGGVVSGWQLLPGLLVAGVGMGLLLPQLFDIVLAGVDTDMVGSGSGVLNAVQQLGSTAGIAALGTVFFTRLEAGDALGAMTAVLTAVGVLLLAVAALAALLPRRARDPEPVAA